MLLQEVCTLKKHSPNAVKVADVMRTPIVPSAVCNKKHTGALHVTKTMSGFTVKFAGRGTTKGTLERSSSIL